MKKLLLGMTIAAMMCGTTTASAGLVKSKANKANVSTMAATSSIPTTMVKYLNGTYDPDESTGVADNYMIFSSTTSAVFNKYHGPQVNDGYVLYVDIYTGLQQGSPVKLPTGTYTPSLDNEAGTYDPSYTYMAYYDADGNESGTFDSTGNIVVEDGLDGVIVKVGIKDGNGQTQTVTFTGSVELDNAKAELSVYDQIKKNLDLEFTGSWGVYDGNLYESNTGAMYVDLYDHSFDSETGGMTEPGYSVCLQMFGKLFKKDAVPYPDYGTYTVARNFNRGTFFPGMETDYAGTAVILGSYVKERIEVGGSVSYAYSYLTDGTIVVEDMGNSVFKITVDCVTSLGHTVKGTFEGKISLRDQRVEDPTGPAISTLDDDLELDLEQHKTCYVWNGGIINHCQTFLVDIGSPNGRGGNTEGDIFRVELVLPEGTQYIQPGNFTVLTEKYDDFYQPYTAGKGRWGTGGDLTGTRYYHFIEGRYLVMDHHAPAVTGTIGVQQIGENYKFDIAVMCDANYHMDGTWTGPATLMYNPDGILAGISSVEGDDNSELKTTWLSNDVLLVNGVNKIESAALYSMNGMMHRCEVDGLTVNTSNVAAGIYVLNINGKTIKIAKK